MSHGPLAVYDQCDGKMNAELDDWVVGGLVFWRAACMSACLPAGNNNHNSNNNSVIIIIIIIKLCPINAMRVLGMMH